MNSLYLVFNSSINGYVVEYLNLLSIFAIFFGILVIINKNPIVSVLFLICLFLSISAYLILLGMTFIGLSYLLVYIGAVSILFLFILMLINVRVSELQTETSNSIPLAILFSFTFYSILHGITPSNIFINDNNLYYNLLTFFNQVENVKYTTSTAWDSYLTDISHITSIGNIMYTNFFLWLIITSTILLLAMVGAIIITIKR